MISGNSIAADTQYGVCLNSSNYNIISKNNVTNNYDGIYLLTSSENIISGNTIAENTQSGVSLNSSSTNRFFHNNFVDNQLQVYAVSSGYANVWDDGYPSGGNYWSNYIARYPDAIENDRTGIWNTPYVIDDDNIDRYPLLGLFKCFDVACYSQTYSVNTVSNSTISDVNFIAAAKTLSFNVTGTSGTVGFCRIVIPLSLMSCTNSEDWIVIVNGTRLYAPILNVTTDANYTYIYFTYHHSTETVQIQSTSAVPEFQPIMLLPLFMIATLLAIVICKRKNYKRKTCFE
jgi:parallel beta-helix repeat protein